MVSNRDVVIEVLVRVGLSVDEIVETDISDTDLDFRSRPAILVIQGKSPRSVLLGSHSYSVIMRYIWCRPGSSYAYHDGKDRFPLFYPYFLVVGLPN